MGRIEESFKSMEAVFSNVRSMGLKNDIVESFG
jgi:hypothetical protein